MAHTEARTCTEHCDSSRHRTHTCGLIFLMSGYDSSWLLWAVLTVCPGPPWGLRQADLVAPLGNLSSPGWHHPNSSSTKGLTGTLGTSLGTKAPAIGATFQELWDLHDLRDRQSLSVYGICE